jgi:hypothetical protein
MTSPLVDSDGDVLTIHRGTSPTHTFAVVIEGTSTPKPLTGATEVTFAIASGRAAASRDLMLTLGSGTSHDGSGGVVSVAFTKEQTEALPVGRRWAELWITDSGGRRDLVAAGACIVKDSLTTVP